MNSADNYISYDDDFLVKQERISDPEISLGSPTSGETDSTSLYPNNLSFNQNYNNNNNNYSSNYD